MVEAGYRDAPDVDSDMAIVFVKVSLEDWGPRRAKARYSSEPGAEAGMFGEVQASLRSLESCKACLGYFRAHVVIVCLEGLP